MGEEVVVEGSQKEETEEGILGEETVGIEEVGLEEGLERVAAREVGGRACRLCTYSLLRDRRMPRWQDTLVLQICNRIVDR